MKLPADTLPPTAPTVTAVGPAVPAGVTNVRLVPFAATMTFVPGTPPTETDAACKFVPVIVTVVPPAVVPDVGDMSVNVGGPMKVNVPADTVPPP